MRRTIVEASIAHFDPRTARFTLRGSTPISFADPRTARAAGFLVAPRPDPASGVVTVGLGEPVSFLRLPTVICLVAGTEHHPPASKPVKAREIDAPRARRRA
jgi:hypothetical protein